VQAQHHPNRYAETQATGSDVLQHANASLRCLASRAQQATKAGHPATTAKKTA